MSCWLDYWDIAWRKTEEDEKKTVALLNLIPKCYLIISSEKWWGMRIDTEFSKKKKNSGAHQRQSSRSHNGCYRWLFQKYQRSNDITRSSWFSFHSDKIEAIKTARHKISMKGTTEIKFYKGCPIKPGHAAMASCCLIRIEISFSGFRIRFHYSEM